MGKVKGDASKDIKAVKGGAVVKPKTPQKNEASPMRSPKPSPMGSPKRNQSPSARSNGSSVASPPSTPTGTASSRKPLPSSPSGGKPGKKLNVKITQPNKKEKTKTVLSQESSGSESDPTGPRVVSHKMSGYQLFFQTEYYPKKGDKTVMEMRRDAAEAWKNMSEAETKIWEDKADK